MASSILLENIDLSNGKEQVWQMEREIPELHLPLEMVCSSHNCDVACTVSTPYEVCDLNFSDSANGVLAVPMTQPSDSVAFDLIVRNIQTRAYIYFVEVTFIDMAATPIEIEDVRIQQRPSQGYSVGFDISEAIGKAQGLEEHTEVEAQVKYPDNRIIDVRGNSVNFLWGEKQLFCIFQTGVLYAVRFCYKVGDRQVDWSDWLPFRAERRSTI